MGVRCNAVAPGMVPSPRDRVTTTGTRPNWPLAPPSCRWAGCGGIADITAAIAYLCSPEAGWVTGQVLRVDGGYTVATGRFARLARERS